jgi:uncharacterized protein (DUF1800 family)
VIALARILTGWGLARPRMPPPDRSGFYFDPTRHDDGTKRFLGRDIAANGMAEGEEALDKLATSPATSRHIARKLAQYFVADTPPATLVESLAARFRETAGDIRAVLQTLFAAHEFRGSIAGKYKTPYRFVLSSARAAGLPVHNPLPLLGNMARLGMPLYGCPTPDGYKNTEEAWLSPEATTLRVSFATALAAGRLPLDRVPAITPAAAAGPGMPEPDQAANGQAANGPPVDADKLAMLLAPALSPRARTIIDATEPTLRGALLLGGPDFMRH